MRRDSQNELEEEPFQSQIFETILLMSQSLKLLTG